jgi:hypothetical protein
MMMLIVSIGVRLQDRTSLGMSGEGILLGRSNRMGTPCRVLAQNQ